ncbi:hypothetical protein OAV27_00955 [Euryarchaeota archaeon]|nr:hypothetical protein [Euryarchaeota archaeon]MDC3291043.1 hypothetical protein [Euryarchaeota archaeon]
MTSPPHGKVATPEEWWGWLVQTPCPSAGVGPSGVEVGRQKRAIVAAMTGPEIDFG